MSLTAAISVIESVCWKYICEESPPRKTAIDHLGFRFSHLLSDIDHCCITGILLIQRFLISSCQRFRAAVLALECSDLDLGRLEEDITSKKRKQSR